MELQVLLRMLLTAWVSRTPLRIEGGAGGHKTDELSRHFWSQRCDLNCKLRHISGKQKHNFHTDWGWDSLRFSWDGIYITLVTASSNIHWRNCSSVVLRVYNQVSWPNGCQVSAVWFEHSPSSYSDWHMAIPCIASEGKRITLTSQGTQNIFKCDKCDAKNTGGSRRQEHSGTVQANKANSKDCKHS